MTTTPITQPPHTLTLGDILDLFQTDIFDWSEKNGVKIWDLDNYWPGVKPGPMGAVEADQYIGVTVHTVGHTDEYCREDLRVLRVIVHLLTRDGDAYELADLAGTIGLMALAPLVKTCGWRNHNIPQKIA